MKELKEKIIESATECVCIYINTVELDCFNYK